LHFEDGYSVHTHLKDRFLRYTLRLITDPAVQAERALVADVQRATALRDQEKIVALLKRVDQWPADLWILRWGASLSESIGHSDLALPFWKRVIQLKDDPQARLALAKEALETGAVNEADRHVTALLQAEPSHGEGWLLRGIVAMQVKAYHDAEQAFERAKLSGADSRKASLGHGHGGDGQPTARRMPGRTRWRSAPASRTMKNACIGCSNAERRFNAGMRSPHGSRRSWPAIRAILLCDLPSPEYC
jgi:tetratricopeptide (TPR) repeat protein